MSKKRGLLISRQIATARALAAWLAEPTTLENFELTLLYYPPSSGAVDQISIPKKLIQTFEAPEHADYDFILSGTSIEKNDDAKFFAWAREKGIPSFAFIDQWVNFPQRFVTEHLPDHILVVDRVAAAECLEQVAGSYEVHAAGSPALTTLGNFWKSHTRRPEKANHIYFASEPSSLAGGDREYFETHGINDLTAFEYLIKHIENNQSEKWKVSILLHPIDKADRWQPLLQKLTSLKNAVIDFTKISKDEVLEKADWIAGMRSFLLLESGLLGIPTLSLQINRLTESGLTDEKKFIRVATKTDQINLNLRENTVQTENLENHWTETIQQVLKK